LAAGITRYRALAGRVERRFAQEIDDLADELADAARTGPGTIRAGLLALLWTLGFVPEAEGLRRSGGTPSRPMLRTVVRQSIERIPTDPLTQFLWLELTDRPPLGPPGDSFFPVGQRWAP